MIPMSKRLQYANGFLELGMLDEASNEIELVEGEDRMSVEVMAFRSRMYCDAKQWELMEAVSKYVAENAPDNPQGWIMWANALRFQERYQEAKNVAFAGLDKHPEEAALWFNLACYFSLLGNQEKASENLSKATGLNKKLQQQALDDPDLSALWEWIENEE